MLFRAEDLPRAWEYIRCMFCLDHNAAGDALAAFILKDSAVIYILGILFSIPIIPFIAEKQRTANLSHCWTDWALPALW